MRHKFCNVHSKFSASTQFSAGFVDFWFNAEVIHDRSESVRGPERSLETEIHHAESIKITVSYAYFSPVVNNSMYDPRDGVSRNFGQKLVALAYLNERVACT